MSRNPDWRRHWRPRQEAPLCSDELAQQIHAAFGARSEAQRTKPQNEGGTQDTAAPPTLSLARARRSPHFPRPPGYAPLKLPLRAGTSAPSAPVGSDLARLAGGGAGCGATLTPAASRQRAQRTSAAATMSGSRTTAAAPAAAVRGGGAARGRKGAVSEKPQHADIAAAARWNARALARVPHPQCLWSTASGRPRASAKP